jgi:hypothetical protein
MDYIKWCPLYFELPTINTTEKLKIKSQHEKVKTLLKMNWQILERFPSDLKDRKREGFGLAGSGLGCHQDVTTTEGNGFGLKIRW